MKYKCFYTNEEGNIRFTQEELEKLINEIYEEGFADGKLQGSVVYPLTCPNPYPNPITYPTVTYATDSVKISSEDFGSLTAGKQEKYSNVPEVKIVPLNNETITK